MFHTAFTLSGSDTKNASVSIAVFKNGAVVQGSVVFIDFSGGTSATAIHTMMTLATNDYLELYARSDTANNILTISYLNGFAMALTS
jgi:hypothetical protein